MFACSQVIKKLFSSLQNVDKLTLQREGIKVVFLELHQPPCKCDKERIKAEMFILSSAPYTLIVNQLSEFKNEWEHQNFYPLMNELHTQSSARVCLSVCVCVCGCVVSPLHGTGRQMEDGLSKGNTKDLKAF